MVYASTLTSDVVYHRTLYESKGLEFDDVSFQSRALPYHYLTNLSFQVLLYNFFNDSTMTASQWRVVLNGLPGHKAPEFDEVRHSGICREVRDRCSLWTRAYRQPW